MKNYFIAALKRSGQHGIINWLCHQIPHDSIHVNNAIKGWEEKRLLPMTDAMVVFYKWNEGEKNHNIKNYFYDWKLDISLNQALKNEFYQDTRNNTFKNVKSMLYNVEDFNLDLYDKKSFSEFKETLNCQKIIIIRSVENFVASCLQRKIDPPDPGATDVADNLTQRMILWKQYAHMALSNSDYYVIKFDNWFQNKDYRRKICEDLNLTFTDNGLNSVMNFGSGSSFNRQLFDKNAQNMNVLNRWKEFSDQKKLWSYIDEESKFLNKKLFGEK